MRWRVCAAPRLQARDTPANVHWMLCMTIWQTMECVAAGAHAGASPQALAALQSVEALAMCAGAAALQAPEARLALLRAIGRLCAAAQE